LVRNIDLPSAAPTAAVPMRSAAGGGSERRAAEESRGAALI